MNLEMHSSKYISRLLVSLVILSLFGAFQRPCSAQVIDRLGRLVEQTTSSSGPSSSSVQVPTFVPGIQDKLEILRNALKNNLDPTRILVDRYDLYATTFSQIMALHPERLRSTPFVIFKGEDGVDEGGLSRALFAMISKEIADPNRGLFRMIADFNFALQINPKSKELLHEFRFIGRILGMSILHNLMLDVHFVPSLFKAIQGLELTLADMELENPKKHHTLSKVLAYEDIDLLKWSMTTAIEGPGEDMQDIELVPNGENILVTNANKEQYIDLTVKAELVTAFKDQIGAIQQGLYEIVPKKYILHFQASELGLVVSGKQGGGPTVEEFKEIVKFEGYEDDQATVDKFWECVTNWDFAQRAKLIDFVTGCPVIPPVELRKPNENLFLVRKVELTGRFDLPSSHTCDKSLDLPAFPDPNVLCEKIEFTLAHSEGFFLE